MKLAAQIYIFTPFGGLFWAMYNVNHGPFKFQIKLQGKKKLQASNLFTYAGIYLFSTTTTNIHVTHNHHPHLPYYPQ